MLRKENISIEKIGKQRFWFGIIVGLFSALSISIAFNRLREIFRLFTSFNADLLILKQNELIFFNYFFASLSTVLGLSMTIWIWMNSHSHIRRKDRLLKQQSRTNALLIFWIVLMLITRFGTILPIILFGMAGYDNQLRLYEDYWILFLLLPIVIFGQNWFIVRRIYKSLKWILYSFISCAIATIILVLTTSVNQEKLNEGYFKKYQTDFNYINNELNNAKNKYNIEYDQQTIEILKKWKTESSVNQVASIKNAFTKNNRVSLDTIILQKIVIHNLKEGGYLFWKNSLDNWHYSLPSDVYNQLEIFNSEDNETKELILILKEQIDLVNTPKIEWNKYKNYTETERRKSRFASYNLPTQITRQLILIRDSIINDEKYNNVKALLPEIINKENNNVP